MLLLLAAAALLAQPAAEHPLPAPAAGPAQAGLRGHLTIHAPAAAQRHWVHYSRADIILFRATVAGREAWALLDTGADHSIIDSGLARAAGLAVAGSGPAIRTPTGVMTSGIVRDVTLAIPDHLTVQMTIAPEADLSRLSAQLGQPVGFVLGWDVLGQVALVVDPGRQAFWIARSDEVRAPAGSRALPFSREGRRLPVRIGDHELSLLLDLGHNGVIGLRPEAWALVAPPGTETTAGRSLQAEGEVTPIRLGRLPQVTLGNATLNNVPTSIRPLANISADGIIGMGLFRRVGFLLDAPGGRMWLLPGEMAAHVAGTEMPATPNGGASAGQQGSDPGERRDP
jgi:hypothetical protein